MFGQAGSPGGLTSHMETLPTITQRLHHLDRSCVHIGSPSIRYYDVGRLESRYRPWWYEHTASTTVVTEHTAIHSWTRTLRIVRLQVTHGSLARHQHGAVHGAWQGGGGGTRDRDAGQTQPLR